MNILNIVNTPAKRIVILVYSFIFFAILSDVAIVIIYTFTKSPSIASVLLYGSEIIIMLICGILVFRSTKVKLPSFIYLYGAYILAMAFISLFCFDSYDVFRNSRKFLAIIPPLVLGYYFGFYLGDEKDRYIKKLILFLTVMSVIGLLEWLWWGISQNSLLNFYSKYFDVGSYYHYIRQSSFLNDSEIMRASIRPTGRIVPWINKRVTGVYFEPFAAGFNSSLAIILILYRGVARYKKLKCEYLLLGINFIAVVLTTSRSSYLLFAIFIFSFFLIKKRIHPVMILGFLALFYGPFREYCTDSISNLGGGAHRDAVVGLPDFIISYVRSVEFLWGGGFGSMEKSIYSGESGYGSIFGQLGMVGIFIIIVLYLSVTMVPNRSAEDRFFTVGFLVSVLILFFFAGYPFGYKTFGLLHLFLGTIMSKYRYESTFTTSKVVTNSYVPEFR